jgi:hypothetical protein
MGEIATGGCDAAAGLYAADGTIWAYDPIHPLRVLDYHCF